jgi:N-acetylglutamate synthase-like GNAT family acetyltransferase
MFPLSKKGKSSQLERKEIKYMLKLLRSMEKMNLLFVKLWRRKKEIHTSFAIAPQTATAVAIVHGKCLDENMLHVCLYV